MRSPERSRVGEGARISSVVPDGQDCRSTRGRVEGGRPERTGLPTVCPLPSGRSCAYQQRLGRLPGTWCVSGNDRVHPVSHRQFAVYASPGVTNSVPLGAASVAACPATCPRHWLPGAACRSRVSARSQKRTTAARVQAIGKTFGHLAWLGATRLRALSRATPLSILWRSQAALCSMAPCGPFGTGCRALPPCFRALGDTRRRHVRGLPACVVWADGCPAAPVRRCHRCADPPACRLAPSGPTHPPKRATSNSARPMSRPSVTGRRPSGVL